MEGRATKRYATLAALTLALGGAVFLNWSFAGRTPQAGTPEAVVQASAEADEDTVQTAARQPETNAAVEPMTAQAVFDPLESEPQTAAPGGCGGRNGIGRAGRQKLRRSPACQRQQGIPVRNFLNRHA